MNAKPEKFSLFYGVSIFNPQAHSKFDEEPPAWWEVFLGVAMLLGQAFITLVAYFVVVFTIIEVIS